MKKLSSKLSLLLALVVALALFATACGSDDDVVETATGADDTAESAAETDDGHDAQEPGEEEAPEEEAAEEEAEQNGEVNERIERLWIGPELVDCVGVAPQKCLLIRRSADGQSEYFYDSIDGFTHEAGTSYVIDVAIFDVENPPADASSLRYELVEIIEATTSTVADRIDGTSWTLLGFRDGDLFDAVPDGVEVTLNFDGENANGSAGCNNFMGAFSAEGNELTFGPLAATKKACFGDAMDVENRFLPLIGTTDAAEITFDGELILSNPTGPSLLFAPAA